MVSNAWHLCASYLLQYQDLIFTTSHDMHTQLHHQNTMSSTYLQTNIKWFHATEIVLDSKMLGACCYTPDINRVST